MSSDEKREIVFDAAYRIFSQYGFRRTSMNDVAEAAGISRPALYLLFENKEDMFMQLANHRQHMAIDEAEAILSENTDITARITNAVLAYERIYYEPVAESPHGAEFMDVSKGIATEDMIRGRERLISLLSSSLEAAERRSAVSFARSAISPREFAELMMFSVNGMKGAAVSVADFRVKIRNVVEVFMRSIVTDFAKE